VLPITAVLLMAAVVNTGIWASRVRGFMATYDRRWTSMTGLHRGRVGETWIAIRTPLAEPTLERQRRGVVRQSFLALASIATTAMALILSVYVGVVI